MSNCWACGQDAGDESFCRSCQKIQPGRPRDAFAIFGLASRFHIDTPALEKTYRDLSRKVHPDKFAKADARERRFSIEQTTALNHAYKSLRDPVARAGTLLQANGFPLPSEESGKSGAGEKLPLEFYEEVMEDREALLDAKTSGQPAVDALAAKVITKRNASLATIDAAFTQWEANSDRSVLEPAAVEFAKLRYYSRFLDEVEGKAHE